MATSNTVVQKKDEKWFIPLESNPELMTKLIHRLGVSLKLQVHDVFSLTDPDLLAIIPRPALALVLLFPVNEAYETARVSEETGAPEYTGAGDDEPVIWWKQTIRNACGLMGLLHATSNGPAREYVAKGSTLDDLITRSIPCNPKERPFVLEDSDALEAAHYEAATQGDTMAPDARAKVDLHFVCFIRGKDGGLWELDGARNGPVRRGDLEPDDDALSPRALSLGALKFLERGGEDLRFSAVALALNLD